MDPQQLHIETRPSQTEIAKRTRPQYKLVRWWVACAIHFAIDPNSSWFFFFLAGLFRLIEYSSPLLFLLFFFKWSILFYLQLANVTAAIFFCPVASQLKNGEKKKKEKKSCGSAGHMWLLAWWIEFCDTLQILSQPPHVPEYISNIKGKRIKVKFRQVTL